ncbi:MAG: hypothetical protein LBL24_10105 [Bacteroidales bacterium]|nr:hypothetical protein [Bacteroidales bacterium]
MGFHMMNLLRRLADIFRINFYCYGCPDGQSTHGHVSCLRSDAGRHPMLITPCEAQLGVLRRTSLSRNPVAG